MICKLFVGRTLITVLLTVLGGLMTTHRLCLLKWSNEPEVSYNSENAVLTIGGSGDLVSVDPVEGNEIQVEIKKGITSIGDRVFRVWQNIVKVSFEEGSELISIGNQAFYGCNRIKSITLPGRLETIGNEAFNNLGVTDITIPASVQTIGEQAFMAADLVSCTFEEGSVIASIGVSAFSDCSALREMTIPSTVQELSSGMFQHCISLTAVSYAGPCTTIPASFFYGCINLNINNIHFNFENLKTIGDYAFYAVNGVIPLYSGLETLGIGCFCRMRSLTSVTVPDTVTSLPAFMFAECTQLRSVSYKPKGGAVEEISYGTFRCCYNLRELDITFAETVCISEYAFENCVNFDPSTIAAKATTIRQYAFLNSKCSVVTIPKDVALPVGLFMMCYYLTSVTYAGTLTEIPEKLFYNCSSLTTINIDMSKVESIGSHSFYHCKKLTLSIPQSVTSLGEYALTGIQTLTTITASTFPSAVSSLPEGLFYACYSLTSAEFPESVTSIGSKVFEHCHHLKTVTFKGTVSEAGGFVFSDCASLESIVGLDTSIVGEYSFESTRSVRTFVAKADVPNHLFTNSGLSELTIGATVENIGDYAFSGCFSLQKVEFDQNCALRKIGQHAFADCTRLSNLILPSNLQEICEHAFEDCVSLASVTFPESPITISACAFRHSGLISLSIPNCFKLGEHSFYFCQYLSKVTLNGAVNEIGNYVFEACSSLRDVVMGKAFKKIGNSMFRECTALTDVTLPEEVESIGSRAFQRTGLQSISIPSKWTTLGVAMFMDSQGLRSVVLPDKLMEIPDECFYSTSLSEISIPESCVSLGKAAFGYCCVLKRINIPSGVTEFSERLFYKCFALHLEIPDTVKVFQRECLSYTEITSFTFKDSNGYEYDGPFLDGCKIKSVSIPSSWTEIPCGILGGLHYIKDFEIPSQITSIGDYAFSETGITEMTIPDSVESLGIAVFRGCVSLTEVTLPKNLREIEAEMFYECSSLKAIVIPESVTEIGDFAFVSCYSLTQINLPSGLQRLGTDVFAMCTGLTHVSIPELVRNIGSYLFYECTSLTSVDIPPSISILPSYMFSNCGLTTFTVPATVSIISEYAFAGCKKLETVILHDEIRRIEGFAFESCESLESFTVPASVNLLELCVLAHCTKLKSVSLSRSSGIRSGAFAGCVSLETMVFPNNALLYNDIGMPGILENCTRLTSVTLPECCRDIPPRMFYKCRHLETIHIPIDCYTIGSEAFAMCSGLKSITLPPIQSIGDYAFEGCSSLTEAVLPDSLIDTGVLGEIRSGVGEGIFDSCSNLQKVTLPAGLTQYTDYMFYNCAKLTLDNIIAPSINENSVLYPNGTFAFWDSIVEFTIPTQMTAVSCDLFCGCKNLETVTMHKDVVMIHDDAFCDCSKLTHIEFPSGLYYIGESALAFTGLSECTLPKFVREIPDGMFCGCTRMSSFTVSDNILKIGIYAFTSTGLTSFTLPDRFIRIPAGLFSWCTKLSTVKVSKSLRGIGEDAFFQCTSLESFDIPSTVSDIDSSAFANCTAITSLTIPESVCDIGSYAFSGTSITSMVWPPKVHIIEQGMFWHCHHLKTFVIPEHVHELESYAFADCINLRAVSIEAKGLFEFGEQWTFGNCVKLAMVNIPAGCDCIEDYTFYRCKSLTHITIPDTVWELEDAAFAESGLVSITIPASVYSIEEDVLANCTYLTSIAYCGTFITNCEQEAFRNTLQTVLVTNDWAEPKVCGIEAVKDDTICTGDGSAAEIPVFVQATKEKEEKREFTGSTIFLADGPNTVTVTEVVAQAGASAVVVGKVAIESQLSLEEGSSVTFEGIILSKDNTVKIAMKASSLNIPKLNLGEVANANTPSEIDIQIDGAKMTSEDIAKLASGKFAVVYGSGANFDCEKWSSKINVDVDSDSKYSWSTGCRPYGSNEGIKTSARLLSDEAMEIYIFGDDAGLSPLIIAAICVGAVLVVVLIAVLIWYLIRNRESQDAQAQEEGEKEEP